MKNFFLGVVVTSVVSVVAALVYLKLGLAEVRGDIRPSKLESSVMNMAVHASVRRQAPEMPNPVAVTDDNLIAGGKMYLGECAGCHGTPGKPYKEDNSLFPPPPQLPHVGTEYSEAQVFWVAKHGIRRTGMFAAGEWDSDEKLWTVAAYIKRMNNLPPRAKEELEKAVKGGG